MQTASSNPRKKTQTGQFHYEAGMYTEWDCAGMATANMASPNTVSLLFPKGPAKRSRDG